MIVDILIIKFINSCLQFSKQNRTLEKSINPKEKTSKEINILNRNNNK